MKLGNSNISDVSVNFNDTETVNFKIKSDDVVAFRTVIENLYSDVEYAIVRELSTNAIDACKKANKPLNDFVIHVPTSEKPVFYVEDHGIGMSRQDVMQLYVTLFDSTKIDTNDFTGMFGLGSKAPLAYTNSFFIKSCKDGLEDKYVVTWEKDKNKSPQISWFKNTKKSDQTGTKISFNVNESDISKFESAILRAIVSWDSIPVIENASDDFIEDLKYYEIQKLNKAFKNKAFTITFAQSQILRCNYYLEMGNVGYPLLSERCPANVERVLCLLLVKESVPDEFNLGIYHRFVIHAPIGSVSVAPDREKLVYNEFTISFIRNWLVQDFISRFDNKADIKDRLKAYKENMDFLSEQNIKDIEELAEVSNDSILIKRLEIVLNLYKEDLKKINSVVKWVNPSGVDFNNTIFYTQLLSDVKLLHAYSVCDYVVNLMNLSTLALIPISIEDAKKYCQLTSAANVRGNVLKSSLEKIKGFDNFIIGTEENINKVISLGISDNVIKNLKLEKDSIGNSAVLNKPCYTLYWTNETHLWENGEQTIMSLKQFLTDNNILKIIPVLRTNDHFFFQSLSWFQGSFDEKGLELDRLEQKRSKNIIDKETCIVAASKSNMKVLIRYLENDFEFIDVSTRYDKIVMDDFNEMLKYPPTENNFFSSFRDYIDIDKIMNAFTWKDSSNFFKAYLISKSIRNVGNTFTNLCFDYNESSYLIDLCLTFNKQFRNYYLERSKEKNSKNWGIFNLLRAYPLLPEHNKLEYSVSASKLNLFKSYHNQDEIEQWFKDIVMYAWALDLTR